MAHRPCGPRRHRPVDPDLLARGQGFAPGLLDGLALRPVQLLGLRERLPGGLDRGSDGGGLVLALDVDPAGQVVGVHRLRARFGARRRGVSGALTPGREQVCGGVGGSRLRLGGPLDGGLGRGLQQEVAVPSAVAAVCSRTAVAVPPPGSGGSTGPGAGRLPAPRRAPPSGSASGRGRPATWSLIITSGRSASSRSP
ncbi:hypothetical protein GXW82_44665 [Streptacidiphilus sp. 4-A2]|nr:hypothetical protein [Streptacidiphilus sp. 4-A2]